VAEGPDKDSKTEEPTQRKLDEAKRKGDAGKSMDVPSWMALAGAFSVLAIAGGWMTRDMAEALTPFIARPHAYEISAESLRSVLLQVVTAAAPMFLAVLGVTAIGGLAGSLLQTGLIFSGEKLKFDLKKLSPFEGFKRLFGPDALFHFFKSLLKLIAIAAVVWMVFRPHARELETLVALDLASLLPFVRELLIALFIGVLIFTGLGAGLDYLWQRMRFMQRMRMSREELKDEFKQSEGDPHVKAKLKQIRFERSRHRMMQAVPKATVIVTNPTHYAVALRYVPEEMGAPVCVAKGVDALALKIREVAGEHKIPIVEDVPLARALYASVDVDEIIPRQHYEAVARVIGFIMGRGRDAPPARPQHS